MIKRPRKKRVIKRYRKNRKSHDKKYQLKLEARSEKGKCRRSATCKSPLAGETKYCLKHWLALLKNNNHGNLKENKELDLLDLWNEQQGRCKILGVKLIPGKTASLDHILPISKGGTNKKENLQFIHIALNCMKQDQTPNEFNLLLKQIVPILTEYIKEI